jgi:hypothetical protein
MALNFPTNPTLNQVYTDGNYSFLWDGNSWVAGGSIASATVFDNKIDAAFIQANSSFIHANAAYNAANSAANNISAGSITGDKLGLTSINANNIVDGAVTGNKLGLTSINANNIVDGAVTVAKGGTGLSTLTANSVVLGNGTDPVQLIAPGTTGNVLTSNGTNWTSQAAAAGGGDYIMRVFTTPGTYTKPAGLKAVKVTVIGGGGGATTGGTSSFGSPAFLSATGGFGSAGAGSGGQLNVSGQTGGGYVIPGCPPTNLRIGGSSAFGFGAGAGFLGSPGGSAAGVPGSNYGGGAISAGSGQAGGGGAIEYIDAPALPGPQPYTVGGGGGADPSTGSGGAGVIIVEEFY